MSKSGRYAAQRRKVEDLTAAKSITVADCGTHFTIGSATLTHTLPLMSDAGKGWWCRFVVNDETAATVIDQNGSDTADQMVGHVYSITDNASVQISPAAEGTAFDKITFTTSCIQGDWVEVWTDGTLWYVRGASNAGAADVITCA
jgi:hypothetical protein